MRLPKDLVAGTFVARSNRFAADVLVEGREAVAHVPSSGRMAELLVPGAPLRLNPAPPDSNRRTRFTLLLVWYEGHWVGVDSRLPPALVVEAWRRGLLPALEAFQSVKSEIWSGDSRLDLRFEGPGIWGRGERPPGVKEICYVEAKSVNLVVDGVALFPDALTTRGARHLRELERVVADGYRAAVVFVVQRGDARSLAPHEEADPAFAQALCQAADGGVEIYAIACEVSGEAITPRRLVPVHLDQPGLAGEGRV